MIMMERIRQQIKAQPVGEPFVSRSLLSLGSRAAVDQVLTRLTREGLISRVARGVYVRPKENRFVGRVVPEAREIVTVMAKAKGEVIQMHGAEAVLRLGLTTQVPMKPLFYTSGPSRMLQIGKQEVVLKHASPCLYSLGNGLAGIAFSALHYMGKKQVTPEILSKVQRLMPPEEFSALRKSPHLPAWLSDLFHQCEKEMIHG